MISTFLSLSGTDSDFVRGVHSHLPDGLAYYYPRSFSNGENLIAAMEERVGESTVFVFFASAASVKSHWVNFELDRARINLITKKNFKILVFPIGKNVARSDLPDWMSEFWIPNAGQSQRDIARYIRNTVILLEILMSPTGRGYGRGQLTDLATQSLTERVVSSGVSPNVLIFAGVNGLGRRTFARMLLEHAFPASSHLYVGPELLLPQFADIEDLYRSLREEVHSLSISGFESDLQTFRKMGQASQIEEILSLCSHFFSLDQAVTIVTRNGIFEDRGVLKPWASALFRRMSLISRGKLVIIADRQVHENELRGLDNVIQFAVPALKDEDIKSIIAAMLPVFGAKPVLPRHEVITAIGGHPAIAKMASRLIAQQGITVFEDDLRGLFHVQDDIIRSSLNISSLSEIELEILSILSWLPRIPGKSLTSLFEKRKSISRQNVAEILSGLILSCYITPSGESYAISPAIRSFFRRVYGYGAPDLRKALYQELKSEWDRSVHDDSLRAELFDAFVFMAALEGGTLPTELQPLILASTLQELVKDTYDSGHDDFDALERVATWGSTAVAMRMDETTREEILSYVVRALVRLRGRDDEVDQLINLFLRKGYRSYHYVNGFYLRRRGDPQKAMLSFNEARKVRKYTRAVVGELADCYKILGMWPQLRALIKEQADYIDRNPYLLYIYAGMLIAEKDWKGAESVVNRLKSAAGNDGRAETRIASILMQRDGKYAEAAKLLTQVLSTAANGRENIRRMRALAAANSGDLETARSDIEYLKSRPNGVESVKRIEATVMLVNEEFDDALQHLAGLRSPSAQDRLLEAKILDAKARHPSTPLSERESLRNKAAELRAAHAIVDEFDID